MKKQIPQVQQADKLYEKLVKVCTKANALIDKGYIMIGNDNVVHKGKFVFSSDGEEFIGIQETEKYFLTYMVRNSSSTHNKNTLLEEYQEGMEHLAKIKFIKPNDAIPLLKVK